MTQTLDTKEDPRNLGGGWASSAPLRTRSSGPRRRRGAPIYRRRPRYGPKAEYEPPRSQPKQQYGPGPWFQPPRRPYWAVYSNWGRWGRPWRPPPAGFRKPPGRLQVIRVYGLHPLCLCCCSCCHGPWNPGWGRPPGRKKRWGRRGRGLRRHSRRSAQRSPPVDLSTLLRPVNLYGWRAPGMRAPRNTTQFIMNQVYEDMRQQEKLERQQEALRAQQAQAPGTAAPEGAFGNAAPAGAGQGDGALQDAPYSFVRNPSLVFSPDPDEEEQSATSQLMEEEEGGREEEEWCDAEEGDGKELESQEEDEEADHVEEREEEDEEDEAEETAEEAEGLAEGEQLEEENHLPLEMPLLFLVGAEEERESFMNCMYLSPKENSRSMIGLLGMEYLFFLILFLNCLPYKGE
uniref:Coiled-coil glutamate rich protein 1 n=1 Tax=Moschus moschiferus TaxID=68415 RepID=A0A8C6FMR0_MOSMO